MITEEIGLYNMAKTKAFELTYKNKKIEILIEDFSGSVRNIEGTSDLFSLSYISESRDIDQSILATEAEINIYEDDFFNIDSLATSGETDIQVLYYENSILVWQGFVLPDFFQTDIRKNSVLKLIATDRIGVLKESDYTGSETSPIKIIANCLNETGLSLNINVIYKDNTPSISILKPERLENKNRYEIIEALMDSFNAKLFLYKNEWWVVNKKLLGDGFSSYRQFNSLGVFVANVTNQFEPITFNRADSSGIREIKPAAKEVSIFLEYGGSRKYPTNGDFQEWTTGGVFDGWFALNGFTWLRNDKEILRYVASGVSYNAVKGNLTQGLYSLQFRMGKFSAQTPTLHQQARIESTYSPIFRNSDKGEVTLKINLTARNFSYILIQPIIQVLGGTTALNRYYTIDKNNNIVSAGSGTAGVNLNGRSPIEIGVSQEGSITDAVTLEWQLKFNVTKEDLDIPFDEDPLVAVKLWIYQDGYYYPSTTQYRDVFINSVEFLFDGMINSGKGLIFKAKQLTEKYSTIRKEKKVLFSDKINTDRNGYFYNYNYDDTSIASGVSNWLMPNVIERASMFSQARDFYKISGNIEINPLVKYICNDKEFVFVGGESRRKDASLELEQVVDAETTPIEFIYTKPE